MGALKPREKSTAEAGESLQLSPTGSLLAEDMNKLSLNGSLQALELGGIGAMSV